jgi:acyl carrier protein
MDVLVQEVRHTVAGVVGMADVDSLDVHQGLFDMGMDSLMSVELKTRLERQVGRALPSTLTFNYPTIADLAGYLAEQVLPPTAPGAGPAGAPATASGAPGTAGDPPAGGGAMADLSEDELARKLMQRLRGLH